MKSLNGAAVVAAWGALAVGGAVHAQDAVQWRVEDGGTALSGRANSDRDGAGFEPANLRSITITNSGKTVVVINKSGAKRQLNVVPYLGGSKTASSATIDGKHVKITATDGKTVIRWDPQAGTVSR
jgi:hypothetical protein